MADNKKEQERAELHRAIWNIANDLRGSVDGWDFRQYVLGMLFYRYISEDLAACFNARMKEAGRENPDYANMPDAEAEAAREEMVRSRGFFILPGELFANVCRNAARNGRLGETLEKTFRHIEQSAAGRESEGNFLGLFNDMDVNSRKLGDTAARRNEKLVRLLHGVRDMRLGSCQDNTIDAFGDAYEFLMGMYASNAGKSGGEYYTPPEVSELLARIAAAGRASVSKVYDPACGSGSLLLRFARVMGVENVRDGFFGQEVNITTCNLCRINMFLHGVGHDKFDIARGDTLTEPRHWSDEPFEAIVSNPPYSVKWAGEDNPALAGDPRYAPAGVLAPRSRADLAFIMHALSWLAPGGTAAIVCFPGVMYRGGKEGRIRKYLVDNNHVDCVIRLPGNLFFGTGIATCILVLKKTGRDNGVLFIDASAEYVRAASSNRLAVANTEKILDACLRRQDVPHFARVVKSREIEEQGYNLSVSAYVEQEDARKAVDIRRLNAEIAEIAARRRVLRAEIDRIAAEIES